MRYRKKPIVIEAEVYRHGTEDGFICGFDGTSCGSECADYRRRKRCKALVPYISTLEGNHIISDGDYIITGVKGERYPCKPDIFNMTYEPVLDDDNTKY